MRWTDGNRDPGEHKWNAWDDADGQTRSLKPLQALIGLRQHSANQTKPQDCLLKSDLDSYFAEVIAQIGMKSKDQRLE